MSLPGTVRYALPAAHELPAPVVPWRPCPARAVLLVHDMQQHFLRPYADQPEPLPAVRGHVARLTAAARARGVPVVYTAQPPAQAPADRGLLTDFWGPGLQDAAGAAVPADLAPAPGDTVLTKWRYSAFQRTSLAADLARAGRDQLVVCGVYAHIGVQATAVEAFMLDVQAFVVADAVADFTRDHHLQALAHVATRCGVVTTTADVLDALAPAAAPAPC